MPNSLKHSAAARQLQVKDRSASSALQFGECNKLLFLTSKPRWKRDLHLP